MKAFFQIENRTLVIGMILALVSSLPAWATEINVPARYPTIQAAVNAASSGDIIRIAPGVYLEQILITNKNLTLAGAPGTVIRATTDLTQTLLSSSVSIRSSLGVADSDVVIQDLTFEGEQLGSTWPSGQGFAGICAVRSHARLERCSVQGFTGALIGGDGFGFIAGNPPDSGIATVNIQVLNSLFAHNDISIQLQQINPSAAQLLMRFTLENNTVSGIGPSDTGAQEGIEIGPGATGGVRRNTISGHSHIGWGLVGGSYGVLSFDRYVFDHQETPFRLQPIRYERNTFRDNQQHLASVLSHGSQFVNNTFQGAGTGLRPFAIALSGRTNLVSGNSFSNLPVGILLFGDDPDFGTYLGLATDPRLLDNRFCQVATPRITEPQVTGVIEQRTLLCPFPSPTLAIDPAVLLTWPAVDTGYVVECATNAAGPWALLGIAPTFVGNEATVTVRTTAAPKFFRLKLQ